MVLYDVYENKKEFNLFASYPVLEAFFLFRFSVLVTVKITNSVAIAIPMATKPIIINVSMSLQLYVYISYTITPYTNCQVAGYSAKL
jgi:hypothetical protein